MVQLSMMQKDKFVLLCYYIIFLHFLFDIMIHQPNVYKPCSIYVLQKSFLVYQISAAINEMSEANKDLLEKYRKEVALRRKYHEQLVELKGIQSR